MQENNWKVLGGAVISTIVCRYGSSFIRTAICSQRSPVEVTIVSPSMLNIAY
jgi:hypothetical protein